MSHVSKPALERKISEVDSDEVQEYFVELEGLAKSTLTRSNEIVTIKSRHGASDDTGWQDVQISRLDVYNLSSSMDTVQNIGRILGIDSETFKKHFMREYNLARAVVRNKLKHVNLKLALKPNSQQVADRLFAMKNYSGMSDSGPTEPDHEQETEAVFKVTAPARPNFSRDKDFKQEDQLPFTDLTESPEDFQQGEADGEES